MASAAPGAKVGKPSFAKVAAMAPPQKVVQGSKAMVKTTEFQKSVGPPSPKSSALRDTVSVSMNKTAGQGESNTGVAAISDAVDKLKITDDASSQRSPTEPSMDPVPVTSGAEDDHSHLSSSSTKPASFDSKSMASENTFAMDEKESLRPDDSASVQAADEDEPFFVPPVAGRPDPRVTLDGSNSGLREPLQGGLVDHAVGRFPMTAMVNPPRFGDIVPTAPPEISQNGTPVSPFCANRNGADLLQPYSTGSKSPDEKLIEALGTPKDRLLLLQLEEKFLTFIAQSKDATLELPPQNSYERLLTHKLADYYNLARYTPVDSNLICLYKAADFSLPSPLSELVRGAVAKDSLPTGSAAVKIMRRTAFGAKKISNDGSTANSSSVPSKTTSEAGAENTSDEGMPSPPDTTSSKDRSKWTREEKEAHYKAARERIFRDFQEAHGGENSTIDNSANMSRSSSSSGKKKGHKHKAPRDDSFEARSSYVPGFPGMPYSSQSQYTGSNGASSYHQAYGAPNPNPMPPMTFGSNATQLYSQYDPNAVFHGMTFVEPYMNEYGTGDGWSNPQSPQPGSYYNFTRHPAPGYPPYGSPMSQPVNPCPQIASPAFQSPNQEWAQPQYHQPYQAQQPLQPPMGHNGAPRSWQSFPLHQNAPNAGAPYQFGQAPFLQYPSTLTPNSQHPFPGSYNRPAFNPQTRSFVPGGPNIRFGGQASQGRTVTSPFAAQGLHNGQNVEMLDAGARASSAPNKRQESLQKKWGTPAHLPNKPPPSQVPSSFEIENTAPLPSQQSFLPLASSIAKASPSLDNN